jgi:hypothetical protein
MTEEEKKAETARLEAEAKAKEEADANFEAEIAELSDEEKEAKRAERDALNTDKSTDYKAVAKREREAREKAEKALADKRFKDAERKRKAKEEGGDDNDEDDEEDKPVTSRELQRILAENTQNTEKRIMGSQIKEIANDLADSPEEAEAIIEIHANRTFPSHLSLSEQLEEAHAIANRKKLISTNSELKRALKSKGTSSKDSAGTHRDPMEGTVPKLSAGDTASYKRAGFTYDTTEKVWKKKLPTGKFLVKNPKTKQTYVV